VTASTQVQSELASNPTRLPRLLPDSTTNISLEDHLDRHGPPAYRGGPGVLHLALEAAGLTGRGGAGFPTSRKWAAVAAADDRKVVVGNGAEGEPASDKDVVLLARNPNLVLDGLQLSAEAVGADTAFLYAPPDENLAASLQQLADNRVAREIDRCPVSVVCAPDTYIAGEESAVAAYLSGQPPLPRAKPPRVFERGVRRRPTLVQNVETLAHVALVARYGPQWFRATGTQAEPGSTLVTITGSVMHPGVTEVALGTPIQAVIDAAGGAPGGIQSVLVGGYHGAWLDGPDALQSSLSDLSLARHDARVGAGVVAVLPERACGLAETARVARYLANESAGQCGPCRFGLPDIAGAMAALCAAGNHEQPLTNLRRWMSMVERRGACSHPDGTVRLLRSSLRVFSGELELHVGGRCRSGGRSLKVLPIPATLRDEARPAQREPWT
jgi:NADH:ubiquinone oxidoreductase subunit F (NADH-binding)